MTSTSFLRRHSNATSLAKSALAAAVAVGTLTAGHAQAFVVTVGGVQYNLTTFTGSYNDNISKFETPANAGVMPWWSPGPQGTAATAVQFAAAVGDALGTPNTIDSDNIVGPFFAYGICAYTPDPQCPYPQFAYYKTSNTALYGTNTSTSWVWAQVAPVPAPLPLFGAAAAFGFSRQLRKRIKRAPGALGSGLPRA